MNEEDPSRRPDPGSPPNNRFFGQQAWLTVGTAAVIALLQSADKTPSGIGGRFRVPGGVRPNGRGGPGSGVIDARHAGPGRHGSPRGRDEIGVAGDGAGKPIDVGRLERGDLSEGVPMELAEFDDVSDRPPARRRWHRPPEVADARPDRRPGRRRRARRLAIQETAPERRLACQRHAARSVPRDLVAGTIGGARVEPARDRTGGLRPWWTTSPDGRPVEWSIAVAALGDPSVRVSAA